jgi:uncharacterized protein YkwD
MNQSLQELKNFKYVSGKESAHDHAADALRYFLINQKALPKKRNNFKWLIILLVIAIAAAIFLLLIPKKVDTTVQPEVLAVSTDSLLIEVNRVRAENGCKKPLVINENLAKAAQERAEYIAADHWYHDGYIETVKKYYRYQKLGENLARHFKTDVEIINAWLASPKHKDNLLNCKYVETGIGRSGAYVAQEYGKR